MARLTTAPAKFTVLVANLRGSGDPSRGVSGNPVKIRTGFTKQVITEIARGSSRTQVDDPSTPGLHTKQGLLTCTVPGVPVGSAGVVTVADNDFTAAAVLTLGEYTLTSNEDYTPGGTTDLTAAALGAAINAFPPFSAVVLLSDITVTGPVGPGGNDLVFDATYSGSVENFTLNPGTGFLSGGEPEIGPPTILT